MSLRRYLETQRILEKQVFSSCLFSAVLKLKTQRKSQLLFKRLAEKDKVTYLTYSLSWT